MSTHKHDKPEKNDPLGLGKLGSVQPDFDGWGNIESALKVHQSSNRRWRQSTTWLAIAASLVVVVGLSLRDPQSSHPGASTAIDNLPQLATNSDNTTSLSVNEEAASSDDSSIEGSDISNDLANIENLIGLSNKMQAQVGQMRQRTASMPAESALYVAELEDLIAQVDNELSYTPDSIDLWGQRVNLLLDLAQLYQHQWQLDNGRMASL